MSDYQMFEVQVSQVEPLTEQVKRFTLVATDGKPLPAFTGGSHIIVQMSDGDNQYSNAYSLLSSPHDTSCYQIAVRLEENSRGGSRFLHQQVKAATQLAQNGSALARTSLGSGFWLAAALALLACSDAIRRISTHPLWRWLLHMQIAIVPLWLLYSGTLNDLSLMKEYANRQDVFDDALAQHLTLLFGAVLPALVIGVPLGIWCYFSTARQGAIFSLLNVIQTVPSVALFGLLIAPLAALVTAFPWLGKLGIAGTGMTPALIALVLYALLPLVRGVVVGLNQIPRDVLESARAMGMSGAQRFLHVQLPLALPVFLRSLRVVMVQTVGMAVIAALIGAGGFGALVFQGLLSSAIDLVLLGVIPVIVLAVLTDALFDLLIALLKVKRND